MRFRIGQRFFGFQDVAICIIFLEKQYLYIPKCNCIIHIFYSSFKTTF